MLTEPPASVRAGASTPNAAQAATGSTANMSLATLVEAERRLSALPACVEELQQLRPSWPPRGAPGAVSFAELAHDPTFPLLCIVGYLVSKVLLGKLCAALGTSGTSSGFTCLCFLHNVALAAFSMLTWFRSWAIVWDIVQAVGWHDTYCASPNNPLMQNGLAFYTGIFYLSKYYEFADTFILLVKRKHVMVLQTYHHSGAVYAMYLLSATQAPAALWFVCMNSFIHTIMYSYYAASVYKESSMLTSGLYSLLLPLKPYLTRMQISQFFIGLFGVVPQFFLEGCHANAAQAAATAFSQIYVIPLICLFAAFYVKSYKKKGQ